MAANFDRLEFDVKEVTDKEEVIVKRPLLTLSGDDREDALENILKNVLADLSSTSNLINLFLRKSNPPRIATFKDLFPHKGEPKFNKISQGKSTAMGAY